MAGCMNLQVRRLVATTVVALSLLASGCNGVDSNLGEATGEAPRGTSPTESDQAAALRVWTFATAAFNDAMNEYVNYYYGEYQSPLPDDADSEDEIIAYVTQVQQELLDRLADATELHAFLRPALDSALSQDAIPSEDVSDSNEFVDLTGRWIAIQETVAEESLDCLELEFDRIRACLIELAVTHQEPSDDLAVRIDEIAGRLFGTS